jgi:hypothetical protein
VRDRERVIDRERDFEIASKSTAAVIKRFKLLIEIMRFMVSSPRFNSDVT